jgi:hypothetical protein
MDRLFGCIAFLLLMATVSANAAVPDCNIGASPWQEGRHVDTSREIEYRLDAPLLLESLGKGDKSSGVCRLLPEVSTIVIPIGFDPSIDHPGLSPKELPWIKKCGNPIVSKFRFRAAEPSKVKWKLAESGPILDGVDPEYGKTKVEFIPSPEKETPPRERRTRVIVVQQYQPQYYSGWYNTGYYPQYYTSPSVYYGGSTTFIPAPPVIVPAPSSPTPPAGHPPSGFTGGHSPGGITR